MRRQTIVIACLFLIVCFVLGADYYRSAAVIRTSKAVIAADKKTSAKNGQNQPKVSLVNGLNLPMNGGDTCGSATAIGALPYNDSGTTVGMTDNYDLPTAFTAPTVTGCPSCNATGGGPAEAAPRGGVYLGTGTAPDSVYSITFSSSNNSLDVTLTPTGSEDLALIVYTDVCSSQLADAIVVDDDNEGGVAEHVGISNMPAGTYNIVVDGYSTGGTPPGPSGPYTLAVTGTGTIVGGPTPTSTNTPTNTPTPSGAVISGTVTYGNAIGSPNPRFVSNATITGAGSPTVMTTTAAPGASAGQYSLSGFGASSYTVTPTKSGGVNNVTSFDAARVAQHVAGSNTLTGNQLVVADVSSNGNVTSFDAAQIANFAVSSSPTGITGTWKFIPVNRTYASVSSNITGEDYTALLMGEVSGNWNNTGARPVIDKSISVNMPNLTTKVGSEIVIPINIKGAADSEIISYEFDLRYDPSAILPLTQPVDIAGTVSRGLMTAINASEPGLLKVVMYGPVPIDDDGVLLHLKFTAVGAAGSVSPLIWERIIFNDGLTAKVISDGEIKLSNIPQD
ncbi:MAG: cohesin domain-containing protein [Pyrinomonadaceae bacterium]